jgi:hypothetical protein
VELTDRCKSEGAADLSLQSCPRQTSAREGTTELAVMEAAMVVGRRMRRHKLA